MKRVLIIFLLLGGFVSLMLAADESLLYKVVTDDSDDTRKIGVLSDRCPGCWMFIGATLSSVTSNADVSVTNTAWIQVGGTVAFTNTVTNSVWVSVTVYGQAPASETIKTALFIDDTEIAWGLTSASEFSNLGMAGVSGQLAPTNHTVMVKAKVSAGTGLICADTGAASVPLVITVLGTEGSL